MSFVIASACIDCKDGTCVECCPVDCIYEGPRTFYIHPDECIDCGLCVSVCPVDAIFEDRDLPAPLAHWAAINREFFDLQPAPAGSARGGSVAGCAAADHPRVAAERPAPPP